MDEMHYDVVIVGAGPSGLSAAIRLKQLDTSLRVCILEKGSEVGAHIISGCVFDPRALEELIPDWRQKEAPLTIAVREDRFSFLTRRYQFRLPVPLQMKNANNYMISLSQFCRWLARQAEAMGVEIYPGFAATDPLFNHQGDLWGVKIGDQGVGRDGQPTHSYQPGLAIYGKQILIGEGCRGSLAELLMHHFHLREESCPPTYGLGLKEIWEVKPELHKEGRVIHSIGWPLDFQTYGGSFLYHLANNQVAVGFVVGLDYQNPYLSPFEEFQRFKIHPAIRPLFEGGKRLSFGARALNEGGWQSLPKLTFPGGAIMGCSAGFLNVPKIKGTHTAMKSGMLCAEGVFEKLQGRVNDYEHRFHQSWAAKELHQVRNIRPGFRWGMILGLINAALETYILRGRSPWTWRNRSDHKSLRLAKNSKKIIYPKPDGRITFDRLSSVFLCNIHHSENQPNHLKLKIPELAISHNLKLYDSPEQRYCPASVYEIVETEESPQLHINSANCIHCKTCDIKDPFQNIQWVPPEGGNGPNYTDM
ncbi:MAG: electron transfer flavoprotein-ubiquinone oxidoreductase [Alphaproteobacteria bacterium]|nr:electron transfer flavoprotein-ubiquinone oxidoreductase [Alphaproteobacteria bacterium]